MSFLRFGVRASGSEIERFGEFKVHLQARPHVSVDVLQRFESRLADTTAHRIDEIGITELAR